MSDIDETQRDLEALVEHGYLETWIDPETGVQRFKMTEGGMYEIAVGEAINNSPRLVRKYHDDAEDVLDRLALVAKRSVNGGPHSRGELFEFDDEILREWIEIRLDPEGENPERLLDD